MEIRLKPEAEELTKQNLQRGSYQTADEFADRAISMLHEQKVCLDKNRGEIADKIEEGYAAAQRGEFVDSEDLQRQLSTFKLIDGGGKAPPIQMNHRLSF